MARSICAECWRLKHMFVRHFSRMIILTVTCTLVSSKRRSSTCVTGKRSPAVPHEPLNPCSGFPGFAAREFFQGGAAPSSRANQNCGLFFLLRIGLGNPWQWLSSVLFSVCFHDSGSVTSHTWVCVSDTSFIKTRQNVRTPKLGSTVYPVFPINVHSNFPTLFTSYWVMLAKSDTLCLRMAASSWWKVCFSCRITSQSDSEFMSDLSTAIILLITDMCKTDPCIVLLLAP